MRAIVIDKEQTETVAKKFGYKSKTVYSLVRDAKAGKLELFPVVIKGPKQKRTLPETQDKVIQYRKQGLSTFDIRTRLANDKINLSGSTIERILKNAGFGKLKRRTNNELGKTVKNKIIPERSEHIDFAVLEKFVSSNWIKVNI